ncbi:MAG: hypothetical protein WKG07_45405 [Hymenobacter sp.]
MNLKVMFWTESDDYRRGVLELRSQVMDRTKMALVENGYPYPPILSRFACPASKRHCPLS